MFFFIPYGTDAPVYYWPYTTVGLIVVNVLAFALTFAAPEQAAPFILLFGDGLHPLQWVTSAFLHGGLVHLLGNMVFLWSFGLIIEGKLGWYKTLALYLGLAAAQSAIVQFFMLGSEGGALGASGAIFGLMAMSLIWAPENKIECYLVVFYYFVRVSEFEVKVIVLVGLFLLFQLVVAMFTKMAMSSEVLHLVGAGVGLPVAILMLKLGWVDCEHWDLFSVWSGRNTMSALERAEADERKPARVKQRAKEEQERRDAALRQIQEIMHSGQPLFALKAHQRMARELPDWTLPEPVLLALIQALHQQNLWAESIPPMVEYLARYTEKAAAVRLKLAQILVVEQKRPVQALKVMARIGRATLDSRQQEFLGKLEARARQLHEQKPYEIADQDW
jgi:membrane associated rhomboid family serine protease